MHRILTGRLHAAVSCENVRWSNGIAHICDEVSRGASMPAMADSSASVEGHTRTDLLTWERRLSRLRSESKVKLPGMPVDPLPTGLDSSTSELMVYTDA